MIRGAAAAALSVGESALHDDLLEGGRCIDELGDGHRRGIFEADVDGHGLRWAAILAEWHAEVLRRCGTTVIGDPVEIDYPEELNRRRRIRRGDHRDDLSYFCASNATGTGEMFIRTVAAYDVAAQMRYAGVLLEEAARRVVMEKLPAIEGRGGLIAVDREGNVTLPFNTEGLYRGFARVGEPVNVWIYG